MSCFYYCMTSGESRWCIWSILVLIHQIQYNMLRSLRNVYVHTQTCLENQSLWGDKVSMLTHICPHKPLRNIEVTICKITRPTAHFMCGPMSDLLICKFMYGHTWHRISLLRPGVIKQHKTNPNQTLKINQGNEINMVSHKINGFLTYVNKCTLPGQWSLITISQYNNSFHPMFPTDHCRLVSIFRRKVRWRSEHLYTRITDTCRLM